MRGIGRRANFKELRAKIQDLLPQLRPYVQNPRMLSHWLEEHNSWVSRQLLNAASTLVDPHLAGMGLHVLSLDDSEVEVALPQRWKNRGEGGTVHVGALLTLAEFASRVFWERHLNLQRHDMQVQQVAARFMRETDQRTRAIMKVTENEREALLFRLRAEGTSSVPSQVMIFDQKNRLVAEVTVEWRLTRPMALGAGTDA